MKNLFEKVYPHTKEQLFQELKQVLVENTRLFLITANPEIFMKSMSDAEIKKMLLDKDVIITPDGEGIVKGAQMYQTKVAGKIAGVDTVEFLIDSAAELDKSIYIYGSKETVLQAFKQKYEKKYSNLHIKGLRNGYEYDDQFIIDEIVDKKPDIILVALGVPRQEKLIYSKMSKFSKGIFIGVGGSIDVLSGTKKRAPKLFIKLKLEWFYRIAREPKRWKRFYDNNIKFISYIRKDTKE